MHPRHSVSKRPGKPWLRCGNYWSIRRYDPDTGRLTSIENADHQHTYYAYNPLGQVTQTWGDVPQPTEQTYDGYGQRTALRTYREGSEWTGSEWPDPAPDGDLTTWTYEAATGLLLTKTYADQNAVTYEYTADGRLATRAWARLVGSDHPTTEYVYNEETGDLAEVNHWLGKPGETQDATTPNVSYVRDRLGRPATVTTDGVQERDLTYDVDTLQLRTETLGGDLYNKIVTRQFEVLPGQDDAHESRPNGLTVGVSGDLAADYATVWYHDDYGRLQRVTGPGLPPGDETDGGAVYSFVVDGQGQPVSNLVRQISFKNDTGATVGTITRTFEEHRDVVTDVENNWGTTPTLVSKYHYGDADVLGRHTSVVNTGSVFSPSRFTLWTYNARNELLTSKRYNGTDIGNKSSPVTPQQFVFDYDPIGNRLSYEGDALEGALRYYTNEVNKYTETSQPTERFAYDADPGRRA